jgi:alcohol dehydrogenase class IV
MDHSTRTARVFRFFLPEIICGWGALAEAGNTAYRLGARRVLVVADPDTIDAGWVAGLHHYLERAGLEHVTWDGVSPHPSDREILAALQTYRAADCDVIVGMGGRAAMDAAKAVAVLSTNGGSVADYDGFDRVTQPTPPTVMIPATIGSGAEILQSCAIGDTVRRRTVRMLGCALAADVSLVDPRVLGTLPSERIAAGGFDALAMAIEGYLSRTATAMTDPHALAATRLISDHLVQAVDAPDDQDEATALVTGCVHAGVAFSATVRSTLDPLSELLADVLGVARGVVTGMVLPHAIRHGCFPGVDRYPAIADALGLDTVGLSGESAAHAVAGRLRALGDKVGVPTRLSDLGLGPDVVDRLARTVPRGTGSFPHASAVLRAAL